MRLSHRSGFTFIELSIVLVVIGLLAGVIMVGRDMAKAASIRSQISFMQEYASAINAFRIKYNCIPGDCSTAEYLGLGTAGGAGRNGDGNGQVYSAVGMRTSAAAMQENLNVPYHLMMAGLLKETYNGSDAAWTNSSWNLDGYMPIIRFRPSAYVTAYTTPYSTNTYGTTHGGNIFLLSGGYQVSNTVPRESFDAQGRRYDYGLTAEEAFVIDSKLDDGRPKAGRIVDYYANNPPVLTVSGRCCTTYGGVGTEYDISGLFDGTSRNDDEDYPRPYKVDCTIGISDMW